MRCIRTQCVTTLWTNDDTTEFCASHSAECLQIPLSKLHTVLMHAFCTKHSLHCRVHITPQTQSTAFYSRLSSSAEARGCCCCTSYTSPSLLVTPLPSSAAHAHCTSISLKSVFLLQYLKRSAQYLILLIQFTCKLHSVTWTWHFACLHYIQIPLTVTQSLKYKLDESP